MKQFEDPRLAATRKAAIEAALVILKSEGVLAVTYASVSKATGISRSTLYRHWPEINDLRNDTFKRAARPENKSPEPRTNGPLKADLMWLLRFLLTALNDTPWGKIAPQIVAAAAQDDQARAVINLFMQERITSVKAVFEAAADRGELRDTVDIDQLADLAVSVLYFRKLFAGQPIDETWLAEHVDTLCELAVAQ